MLEPHEIRLINDLIAGEPTASRRLVTLYAERLTRILRAHSTQPDEETARDSAHDALLSVIRNPSVYDRNRASLFTFLVNIGQKRIVDRIRIRRRLRLHEESIVDNVSLRRFDPNNIQKDVEAGLLRTGANEDDRSSANGGIHEGVDATFEHTLEQILPDVRDRELFCLFAEGYTSAQDAATVLGIAHLPTSEQTVLVNRNRDRIMKRVRRNSYRFKGLSDA